MDTAEMSHSYVSPVPEAVVRFAPDWMDLFTIEIDYDGTSGDAMRVIVPPLLPEPPEVPADVRAAISRELDATEGRPERRRDRINILRWTRIPGTLRWAELTPDEVDRHHLPGRAWYHVEIDARGRSSYTDWAIHYEETPFYHFAHYLWARERPEDKERLRLVRAAIAAEKRRTKRRAEAEAKAARAPSTPRRGTGAEA